MELNIIPYQSVGPIKLGMTRKEVRSVINAEVRESKKGSLPGVPTDNFRELDIYVYYKEDDTCEAIEIFEDSNPTFMKYSLIGVPFNEVKAILETYDTNMVLNSHGLTSEKLGIGLYVHDFEEGNEPVDGVIVFEKGYYQQ